MWTLLVAAALASDPNPLAARPVWDVPTYLVPTTFRPPDGPPGALPSVAPGRRRIPRGVVATGGVLAFTAGFLLAAPVATGLTVATRAY